MATIKQLRALNERVINAQARVERARLAIRIAEVDLSRAKTDLEKATDDYRKDEGFNKLNTQERMLVEGGQFLQAIKLLRERSYGPNHAFALSIKEAKDVVDAYRATLPQKAV